MPTEDTPQHAESSRFDRVRQDVERIMELYVQLDYFSVGSAAGQFVIDETRVGRTRRRRIAPLAQPKNVEERDSRRTAEIRAAVYAPPEAPVVYSDCLSSDGKPVRLRRVAPLVDVVHTVRPGGGRGHTGGVIRTDRRMQLWKATIAKKIAKVASCCVFCKPILGDTSDPCLHAPLLIKAAELKVLLSEVRNIRKDADTALGSQTRRQQLGESGIRSAGVRRARARTHEDELSSMRRSIVHTLAYGQAVEMFDIACSMDAETRAYCYRENEV